jgi:hypothetical protein
MKEHIKNELLRTFWPRPFPHFLRELLLLQLSASSNQGKDRVTAYVVTEVHRRL